MSCDAGLRGWRNITDRAGRQQLPMMACPSSVCSVPPVRPRTWKRRVTRSALQELSTAPAVQRVAGPERPLTEIACRLADGRHHGRFESSRRLQAHVLSEPSARRWCKRSLSGIDAADTTCLVYAAVPRHTSLLRATGGTRRSLCTLGAAGALLGLQGSLFDSKAPLLTSQPRVCPHIAKVRHCRHSPAALDRVGDSHIFIVRQQQTHLCIQRPRKAPCTPTAV